MRLRSLSIYASRNPARCDSEKLLELKFTRSIVMSGLQTIELTHQPHARPLPAEAQAQLKTAGSLKTERDPPQMSRRRDLGFSQRMGRVEEIEKIDVLP